MNFFEKGILDDKEYDHVKNGEDVEKKGSNTHAVAAPACNNHGELRPTVVEKMDLEDVEAGGVCCDLKESDEAIDILIRIFCNPRDDNILITPPTYGTKS